MGRALFESKNASDQALWKDWYRFTLELALPRDQAPVDAHPVHPDRAQPQQPPLPLRHVHATMISNWDSIDALRCR